jgi:molybdate/tungstate transport system substrate-binding protein
MRLNFILIIFTWILILNSSCRHSPGTLKIIHAGSLAVPVNEIVDSFLKYNPGELIQTEAWGSKAGARRISDLNIPCDVFISADYKVIDDFLIPGHASWNISFAGNEMSIVYNTRSRYAGEISSDNWTEILLRDDVIFGRSDPDSDPCGVRAIMTIKLAGLFYDNPGLPDELLSRHRNMIRPKETDLLALLETNTVDYIFLYRSVAHQHKLEYLELPDELNLKDQRLNSWYSKATAEMRGSKPGETVTETGQAMVYGITIPDNAENSDLAERFVSFFLSENGGLRILRKNGQNTIVPSISSTYKDIPDQLRPFALEDGQGNRDVESQNLQGGY